MKATNMRCSDEKLEFMLQLYNAKIYCCTRQDVEAEGLNIFCAFADTKNRNIFIIEDDCEDLANDIVRVIIYHELAHIINSDASEDDADRFAEYNTSVEAVRKARNETELVKSRIRMKRAV